MQPPFARLRVLVWVRRFAWIFRLSVLLSGIALTGAEASPVKSPQRLVYGQHVDLTALCRWWTNHSGPRPLSGWAHLTGSVVGTNSSGWIIEGQAKPAPQRSDADADNASTPRGPHQFLLLHPPLQDVAEFQRLSAQLKSLTDSRAQVAAQAAAVKTREQAVESEQRADRRNRALSGALGQEHRDLNALDHQHQAALKLLDHQIQPLKQELALYPSSAHYVLDCFALDTGQAVNGVPIYEHGSAIQ